MAKLLVINDLKKGWKSIGVSPISLTTETLISPLYWDSDQDHLQGVAINWFIGLDVHKEKITMALYGILDHDVQQKVLGPIQEFFATPNGIEHMVKYITPFNPRRILMENTGTYSNYPFHRLRDEYDPTHSTHKVICMNSRVLAKHLLTEKKTDKVDAQRLAQFASIPEFLEPSHIATPEEFALRGFIRMRNKYQQDATRLKNRIKTLLSSIGFQWKFDFDEKCERDLVKNYCIIGGPFQAYLKTIKPISKGRNDLYRCFQKNIENLFEFNAVNMPPLMSVLLLEIFSRLCQTEGEIECFDKTILEQIYFHPEYQGHYQHIEAIFGMGDWTIASLLLESGEVTRFQNVGQYLSYAGIACGKEQSAETDVKKKPNPFSNHLLKFAYRTVASTILNAVTRAKKGQLTLIEDDQLIQYAQRLHARNMKFYQKANKLASKIARIVYSMLKTNQPYDPQRNLSSRKNKKNSGNVTPRIIKRVEYLRTQMEQFQQEFKTIFKKYKLTQLPIASEVLCGFELLTQNLQREPLLTELKDRLKPLMREERIRRKKHVDRQIGG